MFFYYHGCIRKVPPVKENASEDYDSAYATDVSFVEVSAYPSAGKHGGMGRPVKIFLQSWIKKKDLTAKESRKKMFRKMFRLLQYSTHGMRTKGCDKILATQE
jgi:hypothetical protein